MWNVILNTLEGNTIKLPANNPTHSGDYLCTCVTKISDNNYHSYLRVMTYNKEKNYWHDVQRQNGISHIILAWKEETVCDFDDFVYYAGVLLEK